MPRREVRSATRRRHALLLLISPEQCCQKPGCGLSFDDSPTGDLDYFHIHHPDHDRTYHTRNQASHNRVAAMYREHAAGIKLEVWCRSCNGWEGNQHKQKKRRKPGTDRRAKR